MAKFLRYEPCPKCRENGRDRRGDNLAVYSDGGIHCYACGYHRNARLYLKTEPEKYEQTSALPRDFTREVPAAGWKWLLQWGLPYSYWKTFTGYSPSTERLILTHGEPIEYCVGRYIGTDAGQRKWRAWGDRLRTATILGDTATNPTKELIIVEDLISAHKVAQVVPCLPLFGTSLYPKAIAALRALKRPTTLWLDRDQYTLLAPKINRLQAVLNVPVRFVSTDKDPKAYSLDEIKEILNG